MIVGEGVGEHDCVDGPGMTDGVTSHHSASQWIGPPTGKTSVGFVRHVVLYVSSLTLLLIPMPRPPWLVLGNSRIRKAKVSGRRGFRVTLIPKLSATLKDVMR